MAGMGLTPGVRLKEVSVKRELALIGSLSTRFKKSYSYSYLKVPIV